jgi:outer membrane protein assembly factor BamB
VIVGGGNSDVVHSNANARGQVVALDRKTGNILWKTPLEDSVLGSISYRDGVLICPSRTGEVLALSAKDGRILWRTHISGNSPVIAGCPFTDRRIYALSADGNLAALNPLTGDVLEKIFVNDKAKPGTGLSTSTPVVANGHVYVGTETGGMICVGGAEVLK